MKALWIHNLFFSFILNGQVDHVTLNKKVSVFPNISGVYYGEIPYYMLCDSAGIVTGNDLKIIKFSLQYSDGKNNTTNSFYGNNIPDSICFKIAMCSINQMIFFTDILAVNQEGKLINLVSFNLIPIKNDD
ncbi:MAG: hypothetical protein HYR91_07140 [Flavobacteriia bacterium]|nr:hypothetical protein [Flavobacteriia bacterium]